MAKMIFARTVEYRGVVYPPNTPVEIGSKDVRNFAQVESWLLAEPAKVEPAKAKPEKKK